MLACEIILSGPILDAHLGFPFARLTAETVEEARVCYGMLVKNGAGLVKVHNKTPRLVFEALAAWCERDGLALCGHVPFAMHALDAIRLGQRSIEHMQGLHVAVSRDRDSVKARKEALPMGGLEALALDDEALASLDESLLIRLADAIRDAGAYVTPNLVAPRSLAGAAIDPESPCFTGYPDSVMRGVRSHLAAMRSDERMRLYASSVEKADATNRRLATLLHEAGVAFLAGTDSMFMHGVIETLVPFGTGLHDELELLVGIGLTPLEALRSATINPARSLGIDADFGNVAQGKVADLTLLAADPLEDIAAARSPEAVIIGGRYYDRSELNEAR